MKDAVPQVQPLLDFHDLAVWFKCDVRSVQRLRAAGTLPEPIKVGRKLRWRREVIERWLDEQSTGASV